MYCGRYALLRPATLQYATAGFLPLRPSRNSARRHNSCDPDAVNCSLCGHDSKVVESRPTTDNRTLRRRRECLNCRYRWTTYEVAEEAYRLGQVLEENARVLMKLLQA
jgi:hypothetical protein